MPDLDAIRARLAAATPRPWFYNSYNGVESAPMIQADATVEDDWAAAGMPGAVSLRGWIFRCLRRLPRPWSLRLVRAVHRALLATKRMPEPWRTRFRESEPNVCWVPPAYGDTATGRHRADAELIAHAPDDLEALLALVDKLQARLAELELERARSFLERENTRLLELLDQ